MIDELDEGDVTPLSQTRQVTIDALCEHFANDVMTVEEFERRVDTAHNAESVDELRELLRDLPGAGLPAVAGAGSTAPAARGFAVAPSDQVRPTAHSVAILGGSRRVGRWTPARVNNAIAVCGGVELDFREAIMPPGVTELKIFAMWGGVDVIVPPGMNVECHGVGIMGGFDHAPDTIAAPDPMAPTLRVSGVALMGGVHVTVRHAGESRRDARRRRRQERRERARELRRDLRSGRAELRSELREGVEDVRDAARDAAQEVKRQLRRPGGGPV
ncbi:MAG: DUF1707 domain-containing protein [Gemmatimonadales bacterium]